MLNLTEICTSPLYLYLSHSFLFFLSLPLYYSSLSLSLALQVVRRMRELLGLQDSLNTFALFEQTACWEKQTGSWEKLVGGSTIIADVLTKFEK